MDTHQEYTRINVTVHKDNLKNYRALVDKSEQNVSKLLDEALEREARRARRLKALERFDKLPPAFPHIKDPTAWIRAQRDEDDA
jgi:hypothetical protein